jgi:hypothetical protein
MISTMAARIVILLTSFAVVSCGATRRKQLEIGARKVIGARVNIAFAESSIQPNKVSAVALVNCNNRNIEVNEVRPEILVLEHRGLIDGAACTVELRSGNQVWKTARSFALNLKDNILIGTAELSLSSDDLMTRQEKSNVQVTISEIKDCVNFNLDSFQCND